MKELDSLNSEQQRAVTHEGGPLLIVAGAGTGKTTVLINRLVYLITEKKVKPEEILLLTFTEKAAGEIEERADKALPYGCFDLWINTFHGFGERVLKEFGLDIGLAAGIIPKTGIVTRHSVAESAILGGQELSARDSLIRCLVNLKPQW